MTDRIKKKKKNNVHAIHWAIIMMAEANILLHHLMLKHFTFSLLKMKTVRACVRVCTRVQLWKFSFSEMFILQTQFIVGGGV